MSKVKKEIVEAAALKLMANVTQTMPTTTHKFLLGGVSAFAALNNRQKLDQLLGLAADTEGYIDVEQMKAVVNGGFDAAGGKLSIDLFKDRTSLISMFVQPLTLTITKEDIAQLMEEIEQNAIKEVRLKDENATVIHKENSTQTA